MTLAEIFERIPGCGVLLHSRFISILVILAVVVLFAVVTEPASTERLSTLAVSTFQSAVGTAIDLVAPARPSGSTRPSSGTTAKTTASFGPLPIEASDEQTQPSYGGTAAPRETTESLPARPVVTAAVETGQPLAAADSLFASVPNASGSRSARQPHSGGGGGGGAVGSGPAGGAASLGEGSVTDQSEHADARLERLMDLVMSDLTGEELISPMAQTSALKAPTALRSTTSTSFASSSSSSPANPTTSESFGGESSRNETADQPKGAETVAPPARDLARDSSVPSTQATGPAPPAFQREPSIHSILVSDAIDKPGPLDKVLTPLMGDLTPEPAIPTLAAFLPPTLDDPISNVFMRTASFSAPETVEMPMIVNPEPASLILFGTGLALAARQVRRGKAQKDDSRTRTL